MPYTVELTSDIINQSWVPSSFSEYLNLNLKKYIIVKCQPNVELFEDKSDINISQESLGLATNVMFETYLEAHLVCEALKAAYKDGFKSAGGKVIE